MTSDARTVQLIRDYFSREWPRVCPDAVYAIAGRPEPQDEVFVHLEVDVTAARAGWIYLRCWVPLVLQVSGTITLHKAAREIFEGVRIPSDDGKIAIEDGERADIGRERRWWMSVITFPFTLA